MEQQLMFGVAGIVAIMPDKIPCTSCQQAKIEAKETIFVTG